MDEVGGSDFEPPPPMKRQALAAELLDQSLKGDVRHAELAADLAQTGAASEVVRGVREDACHSQAGR